MHLLHRISQANYASTAMAMNASLSHNAAMQTDGSVTYYFKEWREHREMSQEDVADAMAELLLRPEYAAYSKMGHSQSTINRIEAKGLGRRYHDVILKLLATIYRTSVRSLSDMPGDAAFNDEGNDNISVTNHNSRFDIPLKGVGSLARENALNPQGVRMIPIVGTVQAGAWTTVEDFEYPDEHTEFVPFDEPKYKRATVLALTVQGNSCNLHYPHGSKVFVIPAAEKGVRERDFVIVRNYDVTGKAETTIKQVVLRDGTIELWPRSTDPKCQEPVLLKQRDDMAQDGPQIWSVVVGAYQPADEGGDLIDFGHIRAAEAKDEGRN